MSNSGLAERKSGAGGRSAVLSPELRFAATASPLKLRLATALTSHGAGRVVGAVLGKQIPHHGLWFDTRSADFTPRTRAQMFWGIYESAETRMIRNLLRGSRTVVELGSSLGVTSAHIANVMAPGGRLICVEANPRLLGGLRERIAKQCRNVEATVVHAAITDKCGTVNLRLATRTVSSRLSSPAESDVQVPALTLERLLSEQGLNEFDLVSDIEGAEAAFLIQDPAPLRNCSRAVLELHNSTLRGREITVPDLAEAAESAGFKLVAHHGPVVALVRS